MQRILAALVLFIAWSPARAEEIRRHPFGPSIPISRAVEVPAGYVTLYHSGIGPMPANPNVSKDSPAYWGNTEAQAHSVFAQIRESLSALGWGLGDIVKMTVFLVGDPALGGKMDFAGFMAAYREYFGTPSQPHLPARSTVEVKSLAVPGLWVEIEMVLSRAPK